VSIHRLVQKSRGTYNVCEPSQAVIARFVGKVQELESGLETGVTGASPPTVTSMGGSFYLGGLVQGRRP
jgi:hypothetical protein